MTDPENRLPPLHPADIKLLEQVEREIAHSDSPRVSALLFDVRWRLKHRDGAGKPPSALEEFAASIESELETQNTIVKFLSACIANGAYAVGDSSISCSDEDGSTMKFASREERDRAFVLIAYRGVPR